MKKPKQTFVFITLLIILVSGNSLNCAHASNIEVGIDDGEVTVIIESKLFQNITKFPEIDTDIAGSELEKAQSAFVEALKKETQNPLEISSLSIYVKSSDYWLNVSASFELDGVSSLNNEVISTDLSWMPFKIQSDLKVGNLSYNLVGEEYLRPAIYDIANQSVTSHEMANQSNVNFFSPYYTPITTSMALNIAGNVSTFDLKPVSTNFTSWHKYFDKNSFTTSWNFPVRKTLELRIQTINENTSDIREGAAFYSFTETSATISIPGHGVIVDKSVIYETTSNRYPIIMISVFVGLIAVVLVARYVGKRLMKS